MCVVDGKLLDFIHVMDICSIFGNALDNAIEHVILIPEEGEAADSYVGIKQKGEFCIHQD